MKEDFAYFDEFGDPTSVIQTGGHILFVAATTDPCAADANVVFQLLDPNDNAVAQAACVKSGAEGKQGRAILRLAITETMQLGQYTCRYQQQKSDPVDVAYRLCKFFILFLFTFFKI